MNEKNTVVKKISYENFIFNHQFSRKIQLEYFLLTKRALISIILILGIFIFYPEKNGQYVAIGLVFYVGREYMATKLKFDSKIKMIEKDEWNDSRSNSIMMLSKASWGIKKYLNSFFEK